MSGFEQLDARWRPCRAGIFNVWEYDDQTFEFGDGRLVLRGRNGSGKSNALALMFPFLFDGVMSASRMDPMGGARSMKSLLLGRSDDSGTGRYRHESGTGYVWMEFERSAGLDAPGGSETLTIGIGASATAQRDANSWFFVTQQQVGFDLFLHDDDTPKTRRRLAESLKDGRVLDSADDFRSVLDGHLFGLGPARYRTLVDLLLTLRRPHLAGKLDPDHLSATLSAGLAEVDASLIDDVSHSFDDLDAMQYELDAMRTALDAVERFLPIYRDHLVGVARGRARRLIDAHATHRRIGRERTDAQNELAEAEAAAGDHRELIGVIEAEREGIDVEIEAIQMSPAYRSATALAEVEKAAHTAGDHARQLQNTADQLVQRAESDETAAGEADGRRKAEDRLLSTALDEWTSMAKALGVDTTGVVSHSDGFGADAATTAVAQRRLDLTGLMEVAHTSERASEEADRRATLHDEAIAAVVESGREVDDAVVAVANERQVLGAARRGWVAATDRRFAGRTEFSTVAEAVSILGSLIGVQDDGDAYVGADDDLQAVVDLGERIDDVLAAADVDLRWEQDRNAETAERQRHHIGELESERDRVATEPNPGPPANPTRPGATPTANGSPLYACVDFVQTVDDRDRAGFEAALAAAGLLDARILPDGIDSDALDAVIGGVLTPSLGPTLADILAPVPVGALDADRISGVLAGIPLEADWASLRPDGTWRLGPLAGRFEQPAQIYIGHEARERRRAERLAALDAELVNERSQLAQLDARIATIEQLRSDVESVRRRQPSSSDLQGALRLLDGARSVERDRQARAESTQRDAVRSAETASVASAEVHRLAVALSAPTNFDELATVHTELVRCGDRIDGIEVRQTAAIGAATQAATSAEMARTSRKHAVEAERRASGAHRQARTETERYELLNRDVGADAQQAVIDLAAARDRKRAADERSKQANSGLREAETSSARLVERVVQLTRREEIALHERDEAAAAMTPICSAEVSDVLDIDGVEPDSEMHRAGRAVLAASGPVADDATNKMETAYRTIILDGLRAGHDPSMPKFEGFDVVRVATADGDVGIGTLVARLRVDNERLGSLLSTKEREIFETHLLTNVGDAIRQLLLDADHFEQQINAEMSKAPTASDMIVELAWNPLTDEPGVRDAVAALRYAPDMLSPEQREMLRLFFVSRIEDVRSGDPGLSFAEALTIALDYRAWHRFDLFARFADGKRQRVTRTLFRGLSGGEAATVLHLPLFAAAAAQYSSGSIAGPRLIALDEGFVGIDDQMRGRLMGLLTQLDLDVIVTSHEFWGFYEQVPSLVVYDLVRNPATPGVYAQRFDWTATPT